MIVHIRHLGDIGHQGPHNFIREKSMIPTDYGQKGQNEQGRRHESGTLMSILRILGPGFSFEGDEVQPEHIKSRKNGAGVQQKEDREVEVVGS